MSTTDCVHPAADLDTATAASTVPALPGPLLAAVGDLLGEQGHPFLAGVAGAFERVDWGEQEIAAAQARHPEQADRIWHSFGLLDPQDRLQRMSYERVYRAHCREILDRVAAGEDTRPGTAAEICCAMLATSMRAPMTSAAIGLYMRMYLRAGLPAFEELAESSRHHEALHHTLIDDHERTLRRTLAVPERRLGPIDCRGRHHGDEVTCAYTPAGQLALDV